VVAGTLNEVSIGAQRRWLEDPNNLKDKKPYRPRTLDRMKSALDALDPAKFDLSKEPQGNSEYTMYQVKRGDQLRAIAWDLLGSPDKVDLIFQANLNKLDSPDRISLGANAQDSEIARGIRHYRPPNLQRLLIGALQSYCGIEIYWYNHR
jgi:hypothetical protein